jgi:NAD(P)-dependent dehydrogenase (short-subunit alcohol dehydrogenase family)
MYDLSGKVALVTGAGGERGIGRAIAMRLAREGADVAVTDIVEQPYGAKAGAWGGMRQVVREIEGLGRQALGVLSDVTNAAQVQAAVDEVVAKLGHVDILVNNAGSRPGKDRMPVVDLTEEAWDEVQRVNVKGTFLVSRAVGRVMVRQGTGGRVINLSSTSGKRGVARFAAYCTSKFAIVGFTQAFALEMAPYRVTVNALCPTLVDTERTAYLAQALAPEGTPIEEAERTMVAGSAAGIPLGRIAWPTDVANMAAFLCSSEAEFLTGLAVSVSGGSVMD